MLLDVEPEEREVAEVDVVRRRRVRREVAVARPSRGRRRRPRRARPSSVTRPLASGSAPSGTGSVTSRLARGSRSAFWVCSAMRLTKNSGFAVVVEPVARHRAVRVPGGIGGERRQRTPRSPAPPACGTARRATAPAAAVPGHATACTTFLPGGYRVPAGSFALPAHPAHARRVTQPADGYTTADTSHRRSSHGHP